VNDSPACRAHARLAALVELVPAGSTVADIGADHGLLARWLLTSGRASRCIVTELDARRLARVRGFPAGDAHAARLELRCGDGLDPLRPGDRIDVAVLAGMGAGTLCRILAFDRLHALGIRRLVVQPTTDPGVVRRHLRLGGFRPVEEVLGRERGRFFAALAAEPGAPHDPPAGLAAGDVDEAGPLLLAAAGEAFRVYWEDERARLDAVLAAATPGPGRTAALTRRATAERLLGWVASRRPGTR
jgi:tRNA (adenine22-N1)-methyltransferase